jgi:hypothetical protein
MERCAMGLHARIRFTAKEKAELAGLKPTVEEAVARLEHLKEYGPCGHAFDWASSGAQIWKTGQCTPAEQVA